MTSLDLLHFEQLTSLPIAILPNETNKTPMIQLIIEPLDLAMEDEENSAQTIIDNNDEFKESIFTFLLRKKKANSLRRIIKPTEGDFENSSDSDDDTEDGEYSYEDTINNDEILNN